MANILNDTMNAAKNVLDTARDNAEQAVGTAKTGAEHAVESTRSAFFEGIRAVTGLIATLRSLDADDALGRIGLARRRSAFADFAIFGAGVAAGAGVGLMLAPMSGQKLREMILDQIRGAKTQAQETMTEAATTVQDTAKQIEKKVETKVENLAGKASDAAKQAERKVESFVDKAGDTMNKAGDAVKQTERKVENKVGASAEAAKDTVLQHVGTAAGNLHEMAEEARTTQQKEQKGRNGLYQPPNGRQ